MNNPIITKFSLELTTREYVALVTAIVCQQADLAKQNISPEEREEDVTALERVNAKLKSGYAHGEIQQS